MGRLRCVPSMLAHFLTESALAGFASQVVIVVIAEQGVYKAWLAVAAPLQSYVAPALGVHAASCASVFAAITFSHLVAAIMTIPAITGVKVGKIQVRKTATFTRLMQDMPLVFLNYLISIAVGCSVMLLTTDEAVIRDIQKNLPTWQRLAGQTVFSLLVTECVFYHIHRAFHENKWLYAHVHKIHHTWPAPVALVSTYAHPIEHTFCNLLSVFLGPVLCGAHPVVTTAYTLLFAIGAAGHHSGYWSDDMGMHDMHHEMFNVNYGNAHILDYIYGTYREGRTAKLLTKGNACKAA